MRNKKYYGTMLITMLFLSGALVSKSTASAAEDKNWLDVYEEMRSEMEQEAKDIIQREISTEAKKDVAKEDLGTLLESCDIKNAIPLWDMPNDFQMIADYKKYDGDFSKLITWNNAWYIPAQTMAGTYASIYIQKEGTKYEVYGTYLGDDYIYVADDMDSIKSIIKQDFDDDIVDVKTVNLPFYEMNLIYVKDAKDNEYVIPYEAPYSSQLTPVLETIGKEEGKVYELSEYIQGMDNFIEEYTEKELRTLVSEMGYGGRVQLRLKVPSDKKIIMFQ